MTSSRFATANIATLWITRQRVTFRDRYIITIDVIALAIAFSHVYQRRVSRFHWGNGRQEGTSGMMTFKAWMAMVDGELMQIAGATSTDLPAYDYATDYATGDDPQTAAWGAFDASQEFSAHDMLAALAFYSGSSRKAMAA